MKRFLDLSLSLFVFILAMPVFLIVYFLVLYKLGKPVFFSQPRPGLNAKVFKLFKFRTMNNDRDFSGQLLPDKDRMTRLGLFLRASSIDEIPSLLNVIKGDMSLVGPRPLLVKYLTLYNEEQARRHLVRPGITGWAQVNGRNAIGWEEKFKLDTWYVDNHSLKIDLKILLMTIKKVFVKEGISADGHVTVEPFSGNLGKHE